MPGSITKEFPGIGKIKYLLNRKIRYIRIRVKPYKGVTVSVPQKVSLAEADEFIRNKRSWIQKNLVKIRNFEDQVRTQQENLPSLDESDCRSILINRAEDLAVNNNFSYSKIRVKTQRSRWGSCSSKGNINLNIKLAYLPDELRDYVILHELVHTRIPNHSSSFWQELGKHIKDPRILNRKLNNHRYLLFSK